jgi:3-phenylpropionate/trans-cinnamate dioxygenase ferredoxin subunit
VSLIKVARVEEVPPGQTKFFPLASGPILLANFEGAIYAVSGICPHQWNPLEGAVLWGPLIDCPWHHFQFDCRTGENHFPANVYPNDLRYLKKQLAPLKRYAVEIRDGEVWVDIP